MRAHEDPRVRPHTGSLLLTTVVALAGWLVLAVVLVLVLDDGVVATATADLVAAAAVLTVRRRRPSWFTPGPGSRLHRMTPRLTAEAALGLLTAFLAGQTVFLWVSADTAPQTAPEGTQDLPGAIAYLMLTLVAAPLWEESVMRGLVQPLVRPYAGPVGAVVASTVGFAVMHGNVAQMVLVVPLGLLLGTLYERTGRLWSCIVAHGLFNGAALVVPTSVLLPFARTPVTGLALGVALAGWCLVIAADTRDDDRSRLGVEDDGDDETPGLPTAA